MKIAT